MMVVIMAFEFLWPPLTLMPQLTRRFFRKIALDGPGCISLQLIISPADKIHL